MIENEIVKRYLKNGKLTLIPRKGKKKLLLFRYMAENSFDKSVRYTEQEVNERLSRYYKDYAQC
ncbi:MAG: DUF2087 domain-containing protein [Sporolactobacillus sp.]